MRDSRRDTSAQCIRSLIQAAVILVGIGISVYMVLAAIVHA